MEASSRHRSVNEAVDGCADGKKPLVVVNRGFYDRSSIILSGLKAAGVSAHDV
jgi:hypothetical protein